MKKILITSALVVAVGAVLAISFSEKAESGDQSKTGSIATTYSVSIATVKKQDVSENVSVVGTIAANNDVVVMSETQGRVVNVHAEVGDFKKAGSVLVEIDSEMKEAAYSAAKVSYEKSKKDLDRYESLFKEGSVSDSQIEQARWAYQTAKSQYIIARRQLNDTKITTPISGVVAARYVNLGSMVVGAPQATQIANIVDISKLKARVNVAEKDVFRLAVGDKVEITTDVFPNTVFTGVISTISSKGDEAHTYPVEVVLENNKKQLKAGMFAQLTFSPHSRNSALVVPREAIIGSLKNAQLYTVSNNVATLRSVVTGKEVGTDIEIVKGLNEGEIIVVNGQNNLKDHANVVIRK